MRLWMLAGVLLAAPAMTSLDEAASKLAAYREAVSQREAAMAQGASDALPALEEAVDAAARDAQALYRAARADRATDLSVLKDYATVLRATGDYDLSAEVLARAVELAPEDAATWQQLGVDLGKVGPSKRREAYAALGKALALNTTAETHFLRGQLYHDDRLYDLARAEYESALAIDAAHAASRLGLAIVEARYGDVVAAAEAIDALGIAAQPYDTWTRITLRDALYQYERLLRPFDDTADNHRAYARLLYRAARLTDAILAARRAVALAPEDFDTWNLIGAMQLQVGTPSSAREAYEQSLKINPEQPQVRAIVGQLSAPPSASE